MSDDHATRPRVDKRGERIRAMFSAIAPRYDLLNRLLSLSIDQRWRKKTVSALPPDGSGLPVLDVCTGTGDLAILYARRFPNARVVGVDFCEPMLALARTKAAKAGMTIEFREADALALPFADASFQIAMVAFGLRNVADTDGGLRELARVTAAGGRVAILEFSTPRAPLLRGGYLLYFRRLLPWIGQRISPNRNNAYSYLPESVMQFPEREALARRMEVAGLTNVEVRPVTLGVATLYLGRKTLSEPPRAAGAADTNRGTA